MTPATLKEIKGRQAARIKRDQGRTFSEQDRPYLQLCDDLDSSIDAVERIDAEISRRLAEIHDALQHARPRSATRYKLEQEETGWIAFRRACGLAEFLGDE